MLVIVIDIETEESPGKICEVYRSGVVLLLMFERSTMVEFNNVGNALLPEVVNATKLE